jgi:hypothetical protein
VPPDFAHSYIKTALGAPTPGQYEAVVAERDGLKRQLAEAQSRIADLESKVRKRMLLDMGATITVPPHASMHCHLCAGQLCRAVGGQRHSSAMPEAAASVCILTYQAQVLHSTDEDYT